MKTHIPSLCAVIMACLVGGSNAQTEISGSLSGVLVAGEYRMVGNCRVENGNRLTIEAGAIISSAGPYRFDVFGTLEATGTQSDTVRFQREAQTARWFGISFESSSEDNLIQFTDVSGCTTSALAVTGSELIVQDCLIHENLAVTGAGLAVNRESTVQLERTAFHQNDAAENGGAVWAQNSAVEAVDCRFMDNAAPLGGALYTVGGVLTVQNCLFIGNSAAENGGALFTINMDSSSVRATMFESNSAGEGGAIYSSGFGLHDLSGCTFSGNQARRASAVSFRRNDLTVDQCLFTANDAGDAGTVEIWNNSRVRFQHSDFEANEADSTGGAFEIISGKADLFGCGLTDNQALHGGAINVLNGDLTLDSCRVENNTADSSGAAVRLMANASATCTRTRFAENTARTGGAVNVGGRSDWEAFASHFTDNEANAAGGALMVLDDASVLLDSCTFSNNTAPLGGAVYAYLAELEASGCRFESNQADQAGGALYAGYHTPRFERTIFASNQAPAGGAIYSLYADPRLEHCTLWGNGASDAGSALYAAHSEPRLVNSIVAGHADTALVFDYSPYGVLSYCTVGNNGGRDFGGGVPNDLGVPFTINANGDSTDAYFNLMSDPLLNAPGTGDFALTADSPCIDAGAGWFPLDPDSTLPDIGALWFEGEGMASLEEWDNAQPLESRIESAYPNPFNSQVRVNYSVHREQAIRIHIVNVLGQTIETIVNHRHAPGHYFHVWRAKHQGSGVYFVVLESDKIKHTHKLLLVR
ncbi:T9SS type A sorting domain-containing protein [bacterium]|nr:T9SS type A sorting domain-containing protein [bacterium]